MNFVSTKKHLKLGILFLIGIVAVSCKKDKTLTTTAPPNPGGGSTATRTQLTLDSIYYYAQQIYYWNDAIPDYNTFNPRQFTAFPAALDNYNAELFKLSQLKINPATGKPYEFRSSTPSIPKYSRIEDLTLANPSASSSINSSADVDTDGNGNDVGVRLVSYLTSNTQSGPYLLFVTAVYQNSPAEAAGVKRGWVITKVNGSAVGANYTTEHLNVQNLFAAGSVDIEGVNYLDKTPFKLTLVKKSYKSSPVYASKVFSKSGKKIGYLSYARFSALTGSGGQSDSNLDPVFSDFSTQGVTDLIVDLRYNGGGYVNAAQYLANLIGSSSLTGKKIYTEIFNTTMQTGKATILSNQPLLSTTGKVQFQNGKMITYADIDYSLSAADNNPVFAKKGSLNGVNNIVFIVSRNTASASELLINSLKPYMNVKLVGDTTYGKPVGFFPVTLENRYDVYMPMFETKNANGEGGYYTGMVPNVLSQYDDPTYVFGDERDNYLSLALNVLAPAAVTLTKSDVMSVGGRSVRITGFQGSQLKPVNPNSEFNGMIDTRHSLKK